jgi:proteasome alpha subunit
MSTPFYVSPEQLMKDRADFARKGIARGRSVIAVQYADGILFASENPSQALHKVSEIYDRIAFAAVGRYNEFENLRIAGVRLADMRGYSYDRRDVTGRGLANAYAQTLGTIFSSGGEKPYEVELFVAEVGEDPSGDQIYRLTYDGQVADVHRYAVMGGAADVVAGYLQEQYAPGASLEGALRLAVAALGHTAEGDRVIPAGDLEVAVLDRTRTQPRKFVRLREERLVELLGERGPAQAAPPNAEDGVTPSGPTAPVVDDPKDPTDQVSGSTPPLENPVTGEPPVAPPPGPTPQPGHPAPGPPAPRRPGPAPPPAHPPPRPPPPRPRARGRVGISCAAVRRPAGCWWSCSSSTCSTCRSRSHCRCWSGTSWPPTLPPSACAGAPSAPAPLSAPHW